MPELPDVEGFRRTFERHAEGKRVRGVRVLDRGVVRNTTPQRLGRALSGRRFGAARRHGKWLTCPTEDSAALIFHFGMTGSLVWSGEEPEEHRHDRVVFELDDGALRFRDMRKLHGVWLARDVDEARAVLGQLGPDALAVSEDELLALLAWRRRTVKAALMDQRIIAGLGNLLVDEALWQARLDPRRPIPSLSDRELRDLYRKVRKVLRDSLPYGLVPGKRTWLTGARESGRCPRCGGELARVRVAGRTTVLCPREQR